MPCVFLKTRANKNWKQNARYLAFFAPSQSHRLVLFVGTVLTSLWQAKAQIGEISCSSTPQFLEKHTILKIEENIGTVMEANTRPNLVQHENLPAF